MTAYSTPNEKQWALTYGDPTTQPGRWIEQVADRSLVLASCPSCGKQHTLRLDALRLDCDCGFASALALIGPA
ncbi:MAG: hypothetical protein L0212_04070 [Acidobacteria bacterium]|nr:hypothetical protein [Acidobacteriota bacterium]